jgi:hypothetical protein
MNNKISNQIAQFKDPTYEPFFEEYSHHLTELTSILCKFDVIEGNTFGIHGDSLSTYPSPVLLPKRQSLALLAMSKENLLEIGFNAGHSALLLLTANPNLRYTAIDVNWNPYVEECFAYLKSNFGGRINLIIGDSVSELPTLLMADNSFDSYIIDGGHSVATANSDITNIISYAKNNSILCFDDSVNELRALLNFHILDGKLIPLLDNDHQFFGKIVNNNI